MKTIYSVNWNTLETETAVLLDEHNINDGASVETWLCKDKNGRLFTCSKNSYQFSELEAWREFKAELDESVKGHYAELLQARNNYEKEADRLLKAEQKVLELWVKN